MKKVLFCSFGLMWCINILSQVSIELSVHWKHEMDVFYEDSMINTPFLNITYRNNSNENIYFKKVSLIDETGLPGTGYGTNMNVPAKIRFNWRKRAEVTLKYSLFSADSNYRVDIGDLFYFSKDWFIVDRADTCTECTTDMINDAISDIHEYIYHKKYPVKFRNYPVDSFQIKKEDITEDSIWNAGGKKHFVFLKPKETYTDTFNIIAFQLIKGNFTFRIKGDVIPDSVNIISVWDKNQKKHVDQAVKLPEKVREYKLFSGSFFTNEVKLQFK